MLHPDPLAVRVSARFVAELELRRRRAVEYQRRSEGLVPVRDNEEKDDPEATCSRDEKRPGLIIAQQTVGCTALPHALAPVFRQGECSGAARRE
jgi:hypothetical protein